MASLLLKDMDDQETLKRLGGHSSQLPGSEVDAPALRNQDQSAR